MKALDDNVVASLGQSVERFAESLEGPERRRARRFLAELGPLEPLEPTEIRPDETLVPGERVFHASWRAVTLLAATDDSVTVDFGSAGTRTLLRSFAKLRHASDGALPG